MFYAKMSKRELNLLLTIIEDKLNDLGVVDEEVEEVKRLENLKTMILNIIEGL